MQAAIAYKRDHPQTSLRKLSESFHVPKSTLSDNLNGTHSSNTVPSNRLLSDVQEKVLVDRINAYAQRGTLLSPRHVKELAQRFAEQPVNHNWASSFFRRHKDAISSRYFKIQDAARIKADSVFSSNTYLPSNIYNMDETPLPLTSTARTRRVGPRRASSKSQSALPCSEHITCVATIGIADAPVPPLIIFAGAHLQAEWVATAAEEPHMIAAVTSKGWNNGYMMKQWLERCFDPYTKFRADGERRLLLLDGPSFHLNVDFLEACWDRDIDLLVLPPNLTSRYQPLDMNFFATLKLRYNQRIDDFQLGFEGNGAAKGMCYRWIQEAWQEAANPRQI